MKNRSIFGLLLLPALAPAQQTKQDLTSLDISDLMKVEVTSASKSAQALSDVPSAIYVITQEDIRRSGAMNIPEALRLAPGVQVGQVSASDWMVSVRGFMGRFADKLLVLIDGRSVYTPLLGGVYWDSQILPLEDVDRIEVIRGPGGSLWGANAVDGIINIITKDSHQTQGNLISTEVGTDQRFNGTYEYGGKLKGDASYRVYLNGLQRTALESGNVAGFDGWQSGKTGFRIDTGKALGDRYMVEGSLQSEHISEGTGDSFNFLDYSATEANAVARWERNSANGASQSLQTYVDHVSRLGGIAPALFYKLDTFDVDYQSRLAPVGRHTFTFGGGYRLENDSTRPGEFDVMVPASFTQRLYSLFAHDTVDLAKHTKLSFGSKFENNPYTGWEFEPNVQLLYEPSEKQTYWASVSRAVKIPSRRETALHAELGPTGGPGSPIAIRLGNPNESSETVVAYEAGTRFTPRKDLFIDVAAFYNVYNDLESNDVGAPYVQGGQTFNPFYFGNAASGETAGVELAVKTKVKPWWSLSGSYSLFSEHMHLDPKVPDQLGPYDQDRGGAPRNMFQLHSYLDLPSHFEFDTDLYYVDALVNGSVPAYFNSDLRLGWNPTKSLQFSIGVRNAFTQQHLDANDPLGIPETIPRSVYVKALWRF